MNAVKNIDGLDPEQLLGYLMFYNVPDIKISHTDLELIFQKNSMDMSHLPKKILEHDAYRRATGQVKGTISITLPSGESSNAKLNIDEVRNDGNEIIRIIGRKLIDSNNKEVSYAPTGSLIFNKNTKQVTSAINSGYDSEYDYVTLLDDIIATYTEWTTFHTKDTVKTIINKIVKSTQPVSIIKGAYFIPKNEYDTLKGLQGIIADLTNFTIGNEVPAIEIIPLLDTVEQRNMVEQRVNKEIINDVNALVVELSELLSEDKEIHSRTIKRMTNDFQTLQDKTKTYTDLLRTSMTTVQQQLLTAIDKFTKAQVDKSLNEEDEE